MLDRPHCDNRTCDVTADMRTKLDQNRTGRSGSGVAHLSLITTVEVEVIGPVGAAGWNPYGLEHDYEGGGDRTGRRSPRGRIFKPP